MGSCLNLKYHQQGFINFDRSSFNFKELLGLGAFGKVWKVIHKGDGKVYAVKVMSKNKILAKKCVKSVLLQKKIHEYLSQWRSGLIVNMIASSQDRQKLYLVMQYIQGCNLRTHLKRGLTLQQLLIKYLIHQLLNCLEFIHSKSIIHGDIKPENIIIDLEGAPRIMDFGLSNCYSKNNFYQTGGTLAYKTPEVILERNHTQSVDYYAIGVITFELFFKQRPHTQIGVQQLKKQIVSKQINFQTFPQLATISREAADFTIKLLKKKKQERLGYTSINQIKEHPWFAHGSSGLQNTDKIHYLESLTKTREYKPLVLVESDTQNQNLQSVKHLLDRPHIQQRFEAFSAPIPTEPNKIQISRSGELHHSLTSSQIKLQLRETCEF